MSGSGIPTARQAEAGPGGPPQNEAGSAAGEPAAEPATPTRWCLGTRLLVALTAAWWLFLLLQYALSGRLWLWLVPDLVPPLAFVAVPLALLAAAPLARPARRTLIPLLAAATALGAVYSGLNPYAFANWKPSAPPRDALRVMSWNTEYWHQRDDAELFYRYLKAQHADVYLLQEYLSWVDEGPARTDDMARLRREFPGYEIAVSGELLTLSRFPVVGRPAVGPARTIGPGTEWAQVYRSAKVLRTDLRIRGTVMSFYNVHMPVQVDAGRNPLTPGFYRTVRERDADRRPHFAALEKDVAGNDHPLLVAGDFNTSPAMGDIGRLEDRLRDAVRKSPALYPVSWQDRGLGLWRLDWAFTSGRVEVHRYDLRGSGGLSDHRAQELRLSLRGGER